MLLIPCPLCGPRNDTEFSYGGESGIVRPKNPQELSDEEWADYLYMRNNTRGNHVEQWCHSSGCRRWFDLARDTVTNSVTDVLPNGNPLRRERNDAV
jgi:sarcosine oxidase subunit delta